MSVLVKSTLKEEISIVGANGFNVDACDGWNATTYDSCVGEIITTNGSHNEDIFLLKPRGIAWLVSAEDYSLPLDITGITTLKTTWTKSGVMTLTSGIVDPGYSGPLSTAVINFSNTDFEIRKGSPFFRTMFLKHEEVSSEDGGETKERKAYLQEVKKHAKGSDNTFLTIKSFSKEVQDDVFSVPKILFNLTLLTITLSLAAILITMGWSLIDDQKGRSVERETISERLDHIEQTIVDQKVDSIDGDRGLKALEAKIMELERIIESERDKNDSSD